MIPYPSPPSYSYPTNHNHYYNYDSTNCLKYRESMSWKLGQLSLLNCISSSLTKKQKNNNNTKKWYTSNHHYNTSTAVSLSSHHYHQIEFISTFYDDKIIIAAHDSLSLDILSSSCSDTPLVSNQSLPLSSQKIQKMKSIPNDCIVIGCNNGQYHIYSIDNHNNKKPIYSSMATTSQTNNTTTITSTNNRFESLWDFQTISGTNDVVAIYGNIYTNTIHGMDSRCHPQQQQQLSFRFSSQQQCDMSCLTFTSNHQIAIGSNNHDKKKETVLSLYDLRMLQSSCHTAKCCQQYTIQSNHTNVQISQTSSLECNDHDHDAYSIAHLSSNPDTDSICISMRSINNTRNQYGRNGIVWTRDILFDPQDHYDETNTIMTTKSFCQCPSSQLQPIPFPVLSKQHDIMACYYYNDDKEEETINFFNHKLKQPQSLERTKLIGTKRRLYHHYHHHKKSSSTLSPSLCYPLQHQDNYGLSSNLTCMAFDKQGTSFIYGLDNGDLFLYRGIK